MENLNIFLNRKKEYKTEGRTQTYEEALQKDEEIKQMLYRNNIMFYPYESSQEQIMNIVDTTEKMFNIINK
jgi:hypothetical protein